VNKDIGARILQGCGGTQNDEHKLKHTPLFGNQVATCQFPIQNLKRLIFFFLLRNLTHAPSRFSVSLHFPNAKHFHPHKLKASGIRNNCQQTRPNQERIITIYEGTDHSQNYIFYARDLHVIFNLDKIGNMAKRNELCMARYY
jgi:hypothetical protein